MEQVCLAAADVENPCRGPELVGGHEFFGYGFPAAIVAIPTVSMAAITVPVIELVLLGLEHALDFVIDHPVNVAAFGPLVERGYYIQQPAHDQLSLSAVCSPMNDLPGDAPKGTHTRNSV